MKLVDLFDEWRAMRLLGWDDFEIARALRIKPESLRRALQRYRSRWPHGTGVSDVAMLAWRRRPPPR